MLMEHAEVAAKRATCSRQSVGVVIAREGRVLVTGYNGAPAGMPHCEHKCDCHQIHRTGVKLQPGSHDPDCGAIKPCEVSVHAEANALAYAARYGIRIESAELFTTFSPCLACGQLMINSGLSRVVYGQKHRDTRGLELLQKGLVRVDCFGK